MPFNHHLLWYATAKSKCGRAPTGQCTIRLCASVVMASFLGREKDSGNSNSKGGSGSVESSIENSTCPISPFFVQLET